MLGVLLIKKNGVIQKIHQKKKQPIDIFIKMPYSTLYQYSNSKSGDDLRETYDKLFS